METMMTARQVAELLGVHENWVYDQAVAGDLPSYKLGGSRRFDPEELRGWIVAHREAEHTPRATRKLDRRSATETRSARSGSHPQSSEQAARTSNPRPGKTVDAGGAVQPPLFEI